MVSLNGSVYAIKAGILYRLTPSTMHLTALSSAAWTGTVFMASRTWESALPSTSPHGCDRDPSNPFREGCYGQNLIQSPSNFESFQWTTYHATAVAGGFGAPDATSTGELLREDATRHSHSLYQDNIATPSTIAYDWTVYVKMTPAANRSAVWFELGSSSDPTSYVRMIADLSTGTIASSSVAGTSTYLGGSIRPVINGWYQITLTGIPTGTSTDNIYAQIGLLQTATGALSYTGDGSSGVYIWGSSLVRD
jgi:hypothetical protein